jgi:hypothetical protein
MWIAAWVRGLGVEADGNLIVGVGKNADEHGVSLRRQYDVRERVEKNRPALFGGRPE